MRALKFQFLKWDLVCGAVNLAVCGSGKPCYCFLVQNDVILVVAAIKVVVLDVTNRILDLPFVTSIFT